MAKEYDLFQHLQTRVHGPDDLEKSERHVVFAQWIADELLPSTAATRRGRVLDVAGGKGHLSTALLEAGLHCALIDPHAVTGRAFHNVPPHEAGDRDLDGIGDEPVVVLRQTIQQVLSTWPSLVDSCLAVVGLHPDEATEPIVDLALARNLPFAVLPCCVYPKQFQRKSLCGAGVRKHGAFIEYLMEKDPRIRVASLPFVGRNTCVFMSASDYQRPRERARKPDYNPCALAAKAGDLPLLQELRQKGHPWNEEVCRAAAWTGHLHVLEWALLSRCPWSWTVVIDAATRGKHEGVVQWACDFARIPAPSTTGREASDDR
ncbi:unnamed protein product [Polarella glacialis]|uniref:Methyltransferase domain-containing protein n=1 Tax=Polarella glacialis TaxID=89957 RepID=A0A813KU98_POLGL|nr:unnamed protein product [Polarella glacialis]CAE8709543.1 unnamed protein product [Polarella glacialis]